MKIAKALSVAVIAHIAALNPAVAGTESVIHTFKAPFGVNSPSSALIKVGKLFYGVTAQGGIMASGTLYAVTSGGQHYLPHSFQGGADGVGPSGNLVDVGGTIYGTTQFGGGSPQCPEGCGTVFSYAPDGTYRVLHAFAAGADGASPASGLASLGGVLYGTTTAGGGKCKCGTVFSITPAGVEKILYAFQNGADGKEPNALTAAGATLYGTTRFGGTRGLGNVFAIDPSSGAETSLYSFDAVVKGEIPSGTLLYDGSALYGTTLTGGANLCGRERCGTVFKLSLAGKLTVLHSFNGTDGNGPIAGLVSSHGIFYGTTWSGGSADLGTVYAITRQGALSNVVSLGTAEGDAAMPATSLTPSGSALLGTTGTGGDTRKCYKEGCGTVYKVFP